MTAVPAVKLRPGKTKEQSAAFIALIAAGRLAAIPAAHRNMNEGPF